MIFESMSLTGCIAQTCFQLYKRKGAFDETKALVKIMKTCVSTYSFGGYLSEEKLGYLGVIDKAAEFGFDGIEYTDVGGYWMDIPDAAEKIKERCAEKGITPVAFAVGADFLNWGGDDGKEEIARICKLVDFAERMGCSLLRHDVTGGVRTRKYGIGYDDLLPILSERIREVTKYAEQKGIKTMTENHGYFSQDALRVEKLINAVAHPNFGALIDCGNFLCADEDPTVSVGIMAPYAIHVHAKDFFVKSGVEVDPGDGWFKSRAGNYLRGTIIGHGVAKVAQSLDTIKRSGYDGYVTVEFEGMEDNLRGIEIGHKNLCRFLGLDK